VPVEDGAIEDVIHMLIMQTNTIKSANEIIKIARAELASLRRPVDREALVAKVMSMIGRDGLHSAEEIVDAIMGLIGRAEK
jgi:hypothetical protein